MLLDEAKKILENNGFICENAVNEAMTPKYIKGAKNLYSKMSDEDLIISFFARWTGYDSNGMKSGTSSNPTCQKIENMLYERLGDKWFEIEDKLCNKVGEIMEKEYPITGRARYIDVMKQAKASWPKVIKYLSNNMNNILNGEI